MREGNVLFNDILNTFYLVIWLWTYGNKNAEIVRDEAHYCHFIDTNSFIFTSPQTGQYIPFLCYISCGALAGTRNSSMGPP